MLAVLNHLVGAGKERGWDGEDDGLKAAVAVRLCLRMHRALQNFRDREPGMSPSHSTQTFPQGSPSL